MFENGDYHVITEQKYLYGPYSTYVARDTDKKRIDALCEKWQDDLPF